VGCFTQVTEAHNEDFEKERDHILAYRIDYFLGERQQETHLRG